jgi:hypothetical protein
VHVVSEKWINSTNQVWCTKNMPGPKNKLKFLQTNKRAACIDENAKASSGGHFFANEYKWFCLAHGDRDEHADIYERISEARKVIMLHILMLCNSLH